MIDSRNIDELHPAVKRGAMELMARMRAKGYDVIVTSTYRDNEAQNALYEIGRTKPGSIVTNARGGESVHNYRLAFDIAKNIKGQEYSDTEFFKAAGAIWMEMGGEWGGEWNEFPDMPHMDYTGGLTIAQLKAGKRLADNAKMPWENGKKEDDEVVSNLKVIYNSKNYTVNSILKDGYNYVKLRDLTDLLNIKIEYIKEDKSVVLEND
jgi:peptidoglycan L-alanyl-D-glutamate endopeptidase CwlK